MWFPLPKLSFVFKFLVFELRKGNLPLRRILEKVFESK